jgi:hypothetical protein
MATMLEAPAAASSISLRDNLERDGYVLIPGALKAPELTSLRHACHHITDLAREGKWPHIRTLPKQFPPWGSDPSSGSEHLYPSTKTAKTDILHSLGCSAPPSPLNAVPTRIRRFILRRHDCAARPGDIGVRGG